MFETDYLRKRLYEQGAAEIYGEELCLIFYFFFKHIHKLSFEEGSQLISQDLRFKTLLQMLFERLKNLDQQYLMTTVWALGIGVSGYGMEIEPEYKLHLLTLFENKELDEYQVPQIPTFVFSLSCFFKPEEVNQLVVEVVESISKQYCKNSLKKSDCTLSGPDAGQNGHPQRQRAAHGLGQSLPRQPRDDGQSCLEHYC